MASLVGVIHLPALAGSPLAKTGTPLEILESAGELAVREAILLERAGFDGLIIENFGDFPFYRGRVPAETVASMSVIAGAVREAVSLPIGINVLRNDGLSAHAIASVTGCQFIRVNVLGGLAATDQGLVEGIAAELLRERARLGSTIGILADAHVKHAKMLSTDDIALAIEELAGRALADGVVVTGETTGRLIDLEKLRAGAEAADRAGVPLWLGSGATPENLGDVRPYITGGIIVGSALRRGGRAGQPLEPKRLAAMVSAFRPPKKLKAGAKSAAVKRKKKK